MELKNKLKLISDLQELISKDDFERYWPGFSKLPYSLYNNDHVFLVNFPTLPEGYRYIGDNVSLGDWDNRFCGNTSIKLLDTHIAILNLDSLGELDITSLYSILVHESFHTYQYSWMDFSNNELLVATYPYTMDNISLRHLERKLLASAFKETTIESKLNKLNEFIEIRNRRRALITEFLEYELKVESFEGTAKYTETLSLSSHSSEPEDVFDALISELICLDKTFSSFRATCYASGSVICLILDDLYPAWRHSFMNFTGTLFDFMVGIIHDRYKHAVDSHVSHDSQVESKEDPIIECRIQEFLEKKQGLIADFYESGKYPIEITGELGLRGFDPMNIIGYSKSLLHSHFIRFELKKQIYFIKGSALQQYDNNMFTATKIIFMSSVEPSLVDGRYHIEGVGEFDLDNISVK